MSFLSYSQNKSIRLALVVVLLLLLFPALFRIVFASEYEVSYGAEAGISTCGEFYIDDESELLSCTSTYNVSIGNTGSSHQSLIVVELTSVPESHRLSWGAQDIVATNREANGPQITNEQLGDRLRFEIQDLQPNRLVDFNISSQGAEHAAQMENIAISVQAEGSVIEASPRLTISMRFLRNFGAMFGF